jgi:hypothetical protein
VSGNPASQIALQASATGRGSRAIPPAARNAVVLRIVAVRSKVLVRPGQPVRHVVVVGFILRRPAKLTFVIQGPEPSCQAVRRLRFKGHRGMNRLRLTNRPGGRALRRGLYRVVAQGQSPAKVIGIRIRKDGRIVPVKTRMLPAGWCVVRYSSLPSATIDLASSSARPAAFAPASQTAGTSPAAGGVKAKRAELRPLRIGPAKLALGAVSATTPGDGSLFRWLAIAVVGFLAVSFPAVLLAAAWRDLTRKAH